MNNSRKTLGWFWGVASDDHRTFILAFILMFGTLATELAKPYILKYSIDVMEQTHTSPVAEPGIQAPAADPIGELKWLAFFFLGVVFLDYLLRTGFGYVFSVGLLKTINRLRANLFNHVLHKKMAFFDKEPVGGLLTRTINDCEALAETLRFGAATIVLDLLTIVGMFFVMCSLDMELTLASVLTAPLIWLGVRWFAKRLREKFIDVRKALARSNGFLAEGIMGVEILQLFSNERSSSDGFREINKTYCRATIVSNVYDAALYAFLDMVAAVVTAIVLFVALNMRFGVIEIATLVVYINMVEKIFVPIREISGKYAVIQQAIAAIERIQEVLLQPDRIQQGSALLEGKQLDIEFRGVDFRYNEDGPKVLDQIAFKVKSGQSLALVGETGSGKSTIGKLLTRAYDGYQGEILVDGKELGELNYHSLRSNIAVVHQDVELFPGTLRDNITMFDPNITEQQVQEAIHLVRADHLVTQLESGLDFNVHESGNNLSAGQIQLIVFARALAHDVPVILMDEATASVDSMTEEWIQEAISRILKHKTVIIVAHRLSTIAAADQILVLKQGQVIEEGTHNELSERKGGYYANLVKSSKLQSGSSHEVLV